MGPGTGLIVGTPFVVLTIALIFILRRERLHPMAERQSAAWRLFVRLVALGLIAFVTWLVVSLVIAAISGPPHGVGT